MSYFKKNNKKMITQDLIEEIKKISQKRYAVLIKFDGEFLIRLIYNELNSSVFNSKNKKSRLIMVQEYINVFDFDRKKLLHTLAELEKQLDEKIKVIKKNE